MSPRERLFRLIEQLPEEKVQELERLAIAMLPADLAHGQPREPRMSFDDALAYTNKTFERTLRKLAQ